MEPKTTIYLEYTWAVSIAVILLLQNINCYTVGILTLLLISYGLGLILIEKELEKFEDEIRKTSIGKPL